MQFSLPGILRAESTSPAVIGVKLSAASGRTVTVKYATANGPGRRLAGNDYTAKSGILTFAPGLTTSRFRADRQRYACKGMRAFTVTLTNPVNATLVGGTQTRLHDPGRGPARGDQAELGRVFRARGRAAVTVTALRIGGGSGAVGVTLMRAELTATNRSDYTAVVGDALTGRTATGAARPSRCRSQTTGWMNRTRRWVTLPMATGGAVLGSPDSGTVTISRQRPAPDGAVQTRHPPCRSRRRPRIVVGTLTAPSAQPVTVKYATANGTAVARGDYTATSGTLTFAPGEF